MASNRNNRIERRGRDPVSRRRVALAIKRDAARQALGKQGFNYPFILFDGKRLMRKALARRALFDR